MRITVNATELHGLERIRVAMVETEVRAGARKTLAADLDVRPPKAAEQIARRLRREIVRGDVLPGAMLRPERELIAEFGVSRPTLREAFRILESEGLIEVRTGVRGGPQVQVPDLRVAGRQIGFYLQLKQTTLGELLEARAEFEPICVRLLAQRHTDEALAALSGCLDALRELLAQGLVGSTFAEWVDHTREFHELIADHCGNRVLAAQAHSLGEMVRAHHRLSLRTINYQPSSPSTGPELVADYERLLDVIRVGDGDAAERLWRDHLIRSADVSYRSQDPGVVLNLVD
ncbi:MAG: FadR/GntR family transcriptional regulator [Gordonia sp. (in: high G+C Gram-positive bacteria)]